MLWWLDAFFMSFYNMRVQAKFSGIMKWEFSHSS